MFVERHTIALTAATTGDVALGQTGQIHARILSVHYIPATSGGFASTAVITLKTERSNQTIWGTEVLTALNTAVNRLPRQLTHSATGGAQSTAGDVLMDFFYAANERLTASATGCGAGAVGTLIVHTG